MSKIDEYDPYLHDNDEPYQPAPLVTAVILAAGFVVFALAFWKFAELAGAVYQWSIG